MSVTRTSPVVPIPSALLNGEAPAYTRRVGYVNSTTGLVEGSRTEVRLYNGRGSDTVAGGVYRVVRDGDEETDPAVATITAQTIDQYYVVSPIIVPDASWGWFAIDGEVDALVEGTTDVSKDDFLAVVSGTAANAFVKEGTAPGTDSLAIATAAQTANSSVLTKVILLGQRADAD